MTSQPLSPFAEEARRFLTSWRPTQASTMTSQDYERIGQQIEQQVWDTVQEVATSTTRLMPEQRTERIAQAQRQAIEEATHEHIYSLGIEPEVLASTLQEESATPGSRQASGLALLAQIRSEGRQALENYDKAIEEGDPGLIESMRIEMETTMARIDSMVDAYSA